VFLDWGLMRLLHVNASKASSVGGATDALLHPNKKKVNKKQQPQTPS